MVTIGQKAPDFVAPALAEAEGYMLEFFAELRQHQAVVLLFAPADFVPPCTAELTAIRDAGWHEGDELLVLVLTGDSLFSHAAYADQYDLPFTLVSDFHGGVAESYDLLLEEWEGHRHIPRRAAVLVDSEWTVQAVETANPLGHVSPAPVEKLVGPLEQEGIDVAEPTVTY